jgi:hypothetical protein
MKNTKDALKNTLFVVTAALAAGLLAALCSGCDGAVGDEPVANGDAGRADVVRSDVGGKDMGDGGAAACQVPTPKFSLGGLVTTKPRDGYRTVEVGDVQCVSILTASGGQATYCAAPVDGFASVESDAWCCMVTQKVGSAYYIVSPTLECGATVLDYETSRVPAPLKGDYIPGGIALCSLSGKFIGWGCW